MQSGGDAQDLSGKRMTIWFKLKGYAYAAVAILGGIVAAVLYGRSKGKAAQKVKTRTAEDVAAVAKDQVKAHEARKTVESETSALPDAGPQKVASADPDTAAGHLRDDGWMR